MWDGFGWVEAMVGTPWPRCPAWYLTHAPLWIRVTAGDVERIASLAELGCPPSRLTDAGEALVIFARRYNSKTKTEEEIRARLEAKRAAGRK